MSEPPWGHPPSQRHRCCTLKGGWVQRYNSALLKAIAADGDDAVTKRRKTTVVWMGGWLAPALSLFCIIDAGVLMQGVAGRELMYMALGCTIVLAASIYLWCLVSRHITEQIIAAAFYGGLFCVMLFDIYSSAMGTRLNGLFVLCLDGLLVCEVRASMSMGALFIALAWTVLVQFEYITRVGLLDVWGTTDYEERRSLYCECDNPPCSWNYGEGWGAAVASGTMLWLNFHFIKSYIETARKEECNIAASIDTARGVAGSLADFDLTAASAMLEQAGDEIPPDLFDAFTTILSNLQTFRPFLPPSIFAGRQRSKTMNSDTLPSIPGVADRWGSGGGDDVHRNPPCSDFLAVSSRDAERRSRTSVAVSTACAPNVALVFTDIRMSTALWNHSPDPMRRALKLHNSVIRDTMQNHTGYEVKIVGDSFMIAFHTSVSACRFGVEVTRRFLLDVVWPEGLSRGDKDGDGWGPFLVRIGAHWGPVDVEQNFLTGRWDYFGATVNKAARVEGLGAPGGMTITQEVFGDVQEEISDCCTALHFDHAVVARGFEEEQLWLTVLLPFEVSRDPRPWVETHVTKVTRHCVGIHDARVRGGSVSSMSSDGGGDVVTRFSFGQETTVDLTSQQSLGRAVRSMTLQSLSLLPRVPVITATIGHVTVRLLTPANQSTDLSSLNDLPPHRRGTSYDHHRVCQALQRVLQSMERSCGVCESVLSSTLVAIWGSTPASRDHVRSAFRFLYLLEAQRASGALLKTPVYAGLITGPALPAQVVGTTSEKFVTTMSPVMELARVMSAAAVEIREGAVWGGLDGVAPRADGIGRGRLIDTWLLGDSDRMSVPHTAGGVGGGRRSAVALSRGVSISAFQSMAPPSHHGGRSGGRHLSSSRKSEWTAAGSRPPSVAAHVHLVSTPTLDDEATISLGNPLRPHQGSKSTGPDGEPEALNLQSFSTAVTGATRESPARAPSPLVARSLSPSPAALPTDRTSPLHFGEDVASVVSHMTASTVHDVQEAPEPAPSDVGGCGISDAGSLACGPNGSRTTVYVYQVSLANAGGATPSVSDHGGHGSLAGDEAPTWGSPWHDAYVARRVDELRNLDPTDAMVDRVCQMLCTGTHLQSRALAQALM